LFPLCADYACPIKSLFEYIDFDRTENTVDFGGRQNYFGIASITEVGFLFQGGPFDKMNMMNFGATKWP